MSGLNRYGVVGAIILAGLAARTLPRHGHFSLNWITGAASRETFTVEHAGMTATVEGLSGWRCAGCSEVEFDADSARRYAAAGDELVLRDRERQSKEIRRIRRKLGLSQVAAARRAIEGPCLSIRNSGKNCSCRQE